MYTYVYLWCHVHVSHLDEASCEALWHWVLGKSVFNSRQERDKHVRRHARRKYDRKLSNSDILWCIRFLVTLQRLVSLRFWLTGRERVRNHFLRLICNSSSTSFMTNTAVMCSTVSFHCKIDIGSLYKRSTKGKTTEVDGHCSIVCGF